MSKRQLRGGACLESEERKSVQSSPERALFMPSHARFRSEWTAETL